MIHSLVFLRLVLCCDDPCRICYVLMQLLFSLSIESGDLVICLFVVGVDLNS